MKPCHVLIAFLATAWPAWAGDNQEGDVSPSQPPPSANIAAAHSMPVQEDRLVRWNRLLAAVRAAGLEGVASAPLPYLTDGNDGCE